MEETIEKSRLLFEKKGVLQNLLDLASQFADGVVSVHRFLFAALIDDLFNAGGVFGLNFLMDGNFSLMCITATVRLLALSKGTREVMSSKKVMPIE